METNTGKFRIWLLVVSLIISAGFLWGCGAKLRKPASAMDTPEHHLKSGIKLLEKGLYDDAKREFDLALQLNNKHSPAHVGLGLVYGYEGKFKEAFESMKKAKSQAKTKEEKINAYTGMIRLYTLEGKKGWLNKAKKQFESAVSIDKMASSPYFYMGQAYKRALKFDQAGKMFEKVLEINDAFLAEADHEWKRIQKIQRASPGTLIGKKIALVDEITRAEIAALFVQELNLEKLYNKRSPKKFDTRFKAPSQAFAADRVDKAPVVTDIENHVLRTDIETVLRLGVKGLEPYPDHKFHPDEKITRASYAMMVEDILVKVTGDYSLKTKYFGATSPFPDLRNDLPYFNAVMVVSTRGIMEAKDMATGEFDPMGTVSGADALLVIRKLKDELRF